MSTYEKAGALENDVNSLKPGHDLKQDRASVERAGESAAHTWAWARTTEVYDWIDARTPAAATSAWR
jgi:hypothetical protein